MFLQHWLEVVPDQMPRPGFKCIVEYQVQVPFGFCIVDLPVPGFNPRSSQENGGGQFLPSSHIYQTFVANQHGLMVKLASRFNSRLCYVYAFFNFFKLQDCFT
jgi:hypothetical protein